MQHTMYVLIVPSYNKNHHKINHNANYNYITLWCFVGLIANWGLIYGGKMMLDYPCDWYQCCFKCLINNGWYGIFDTVK